MLWPLLAFGQMDTISVGNSKVDASYIKPFEVNWKATKHIDSKDSTALVYRIKEKIEVINQGNKAYLKFTQYWNDENNKNIFTTVRTSHRKTMEYVAFHTGASPGGLAHLDFDGRYISGFTSFDAHKKAKQIECYIEAPVFASFAGLLYAILLKNFNSGIVIPGFGFDGETPQLIHEKLTIVGADELSILGSKRKTQMVKSTRSVNNTYWIDSNEPPYFLKVLVENNDGSVVLYEIEDYKSIVEN